MQPTQRPKHQSPRCWHLPARGPPGVRFFLACEAPGHFHSGVPTSYGQDREINMNRAYRRGDQSGYQNDTLSPAEPDPGRRGKSGVRSGKPFDMKSCVVRQRGYNKNMRSSHGILVSYRVSGIGDLRVGRDTS